MRLSILSCLLLSILLLSLLQTLTFAVKKSYIVYLGAHTHGPEPTAFDLDRVTNSHYELLGSYLGSNEKAKEQIFYSYTRNINGFAAILEEEEAAEIAKHPNVVSVFLNKPRKLQTTRSWEFLGVEKNGVVPSGSIWSKARFGEDTIIGSLDSGIWPESKSFSDEGMGPVPSKWRGICQHDSDNTVRCNRKLIGTRYFSKGYVAAIGVVVNSTYQTVRDHNGHGTHTLSTAAGGFVPGVSVFGSGNGTAKGGSPKARVAAYKVCWPPGTQCLDADMLAAIDTAISDGVDVLSVSIGGSQPSEFFEDGVAIGAFHAVQKGIVVVAAAGNSGPTPGTVANVAPWMFIVGASTMDREFTSYVTLGNRILLKGVSLSSEALPPKLYPLISGATAKADNATIEDALSCRNGALNPKKIKGKILVCVYPYEYQDLWATLAGAVGLIIANDEQTGNELDTYLYFLPTSHINFKKGKTLFAYMNSTKNPMAYITPVRTVLGTKPAPLMASFSSRGPNGIEPAILKPDITAPGVSIIAAFPETLETTPIPIDKRRTSFLVKDGTSMACPHVSGIVGLLKTLHPDWSPAAIMSAIMTTATTQDNKMEPILEATSNLKATPFAYGAGHVQPNLAMDPGLIYDLKVDDYLNFLCAHGYNKSIIKSISDKSYTCPKSFSLLDFNYPSITVPGLRGSVTVTRTVKNVGSPGTYNASVKAPTGVSVLVKPASLKFEKIGEEKKFEVILKAKISGKPKEYVFGQLMWSDGKHYVSSPLVVRPQ